MEEKNDELISKELDAKKYAFDLANQWINNADTKISIAIGVISLIFTGFGAFFSLSLKDYNWDKVSALEIALLVFMCLGIIAFMVALVFFGIALFPNFIGKQTDEREYNLLFYGDISRYKKEEFEKYKSNFENYDQKRFLNDIEKEIFYNSKVCYKKMKFFRCGIIATAIFAILFAICFILSLFLI